MYVVFCQIDKILFLALVDEHVVDIGADLAGIELFDEHDPLHGIGQWVFRVDDGRAFPSEFKDHGREVFRG